MYSTLKMMVTITTEKELGLSYESMAVEYQRGLNPAILAAAFKNLFNMINNEYNRCSYIDEEDAASFSLEELDYALQSFDSEKASFTTYFFRLLRNRFTQENKKMDTNRRKTIKYAHYMEDGEDIPTQLETAIELEEFIESTLTPKQKEYFSYLSQGYNVPEIAKIFKVTVEAIYPLVRKLKMEYNMA